MPTYSAITDAELAVNKPLTSSLMFRLRDNPLALFETSEGLAKAWVNFNGTGTLAIRESYNVTSVTDNGTGDYTVNFTTSFANTDYNWIGNHMAGSSGYYSGGFVASTTAGGAYFAKTVSAIRIKSNFSNGGILDIFDANLIFFGTQ